MHTKHVKSPCCREKIIKFGNRRRQCSRCKKTWRIRIKKVGRKKKRTTALFAERYIKHAVPSLYALAKVREGEGDLKSHARRSRDALLSKRSWPHVPENKSLIALADAIMHRIEGEIYSIYFILLRPVDAQEAFVTPPYIAKGKESWAGWQDAFAKLSPSHTTSTCALVADQHRGLQSVATRNHWLFQGCQFHILAQLQSRRSKSTWSRHQTLGKQIYELAKDILTHSDESIIQHTFIPQLLSLRATITSPKTRSIISGFAKHYRQYRTYLYHPELNLPTTNNSSESLNSGFQDFCYRARGFRTLQSFTKWLHAYLKTKQKITCNGTRVPTKFSS